MSTREATDGMVKDAAFRYNMISSYGTDMAVMHPWAWANMQGDWLEERYMRDVLVAQARKALEGEGIAINGEVLRILYAMREAGKRSYDAAVRGLGQTVVRLDDPRQLHVVQMPPFGGGRKACLQKWGMTEMRSTVRVTGDLVVSYWEIDDWKGVVASWQPEWLVTMLYGQACVLLPLALTAESFSGLPFEDQPHKVYNL